GTDRGAIHVMFMNSDGTVKDTVEINDSTANGPSLSNYDYFGVSVAGIGDMDGDGIHDIAAGAHGDDNGGTNRGAIHVMFMNSNGTVKDTVEINDSTANGPILSNDDYFGASVANIGDLDG
ncbi:MAG: FG-GAP repeat protein, partial [Nitrosopumilaceae archaeon]|nr:FG-GAP repeat protein [Nitrosopumilaceae archaeon]